MLNRMGSKLNKTKVMGEVLQAEEGVGARIEAAAGVGLRGSLVPEAVLGAGRGPGPPVSTRDQA